MTFASLLRSTLASCLAAGLMLACGGDASRDASTEDETAAEAPEAEPSQPETPAGQPAATPADRAHAPLAPEDIDRWAKGMAGELEAVQAAAAKRKAATTGEDSLSAMMGAQDMATVSAGAAAAGVDEERYKVLRNSLSEAATYLTPELGGIDTTMLSPEQRTEMRQMNEAQLKQLEQQVPANVIDAMRPRAAELRKQSLELVGARLKAAGL